MKASLLLLGIIAMLGAVAQAQTYSYDAAGRLVQVAYLQGNGIRYGYDAADNMISVTAISLPAAPGGLSVTLTAETCAELNWQDLSSGESGFVVMRRPADNNDWQDIATVGSNTTTYTDCSVNATENFVYRVAARSGEGRSAHSSELASNPAANPAELFRDDFENGGSP